MEIKKRTKKYAKRALIGVGVVALCVGAYKLGYEMSGREIAKVVTEEGETFMRFGKTCVYMHYEA